MNITAGTLLISTPNIGDPNFEKSVIFICDYNDEGAMGFQLNHIFSRKFNELIDFQNSKPLDLFQGGPVGVDSLYFIHNRPDIISNGILIEDGVFLGGNFEQVLSLLNNNSISPKEIKIFIGYSGWDVGQLEAEIEEGCWLPVGKAAIETLFTTHTNILWQTLYASCMN